MSFDTTLLCLMTQSVDWSQVSTTDGFGNETYGASAAVLCRIDEETRAHPDADRQDKSHADPARTVEFICQITTPKIAVDDKIEEGGDTMYVTNVTVMYDEDGEHHLVVEAATSDSK